MADMEGSPLGRGDDNATTAFLEQAIDPKGAYLFDFDVRFGWDPDLGGSDGPGHGLTFCVLGTSTGAMYLDLRVGDDGGSLGYGSIHVSRDEKKLRTRTIARNSFAIEFDCWYHEDRNDGTGANISGWDAGGGEMGTGTALYHIGLDVASCVSSAQRNIQLGVRDEELPDIFHPDGIHASVLYDGGRVKCWVRPNSEEAEPRLVIDYEIEPVELNSPEALVGFTSATGDPSATMEVDNLVVTDLLLAPQVPFHRGDADGDGALNITDPIYLLNFLFLGGHGPGCLEAANADDRDGINITDSIYLLNFLFLGGPDPPSPGAVKKPCGPDPAGSTSDLGCEEYAGC
jgi:hypothetical protein